MCTKIPQKIGGNCFLHLQGFPVQESVVEQYVAEPPHNANEFAIVEDGEIHHQTKCVVSDQILASFPGPALFFIACSMEKQVCTASDEKQARVWE